jgi:hypothetical protein
LRSIVRWGIANLFAEKGGNSQKRDDHLVEMSGLRHSAERINGIRNGPENSASEEEEPTLSELR